MKVERRKWNERIKKNMKSNSKVKSERERKKWNERKIRMKKNEKEEGKRNIDEKVNTDMKKK